MSKTFTDDGDHGRPRGLHRFDVAQGYVPHRVRLTGRTADQVLNLASDVMGGAPAILWSSAEVEDWQGPPAIWAQWAA